MIVPTDDVKVILPSAATVALTAARATASVSSKTGRIQTSPVTNPVVLGAALMRNEYAFPPAVANVPMVCRAALVDALVNKHHDRPARLSAAFVGVVPENVHGDVPTVQFCSTRFVVAGSSNSATASRTPSPSVSMAMNRG